MTTIWRLWCSRCRDLHETESSILAKILMKTNSGCDGRYYYWTDYDNNPLEKPLVSEFPLKMRWWDLQGAPPIKWEEK